MHKLSGQPQFVLDQAYHLAEDLGEEVVLVLCYDDFNAIKRVRTEIDESQHFLFCDVRARMLQVDKTSLEFIYVWDAVEYILELMDENLNVFVFEFSFLHQSKGMQSRITRHADLLKIPQVNFNLLVLSRIK